MRCGRKRILLYRTVLQVKRGVFLSCILVLHFWNYVHLLPMNYTFQGFKGKYNVYIFVFYLYIYIYRERDVLSDVTMLIQKLKCTYPTPFLITYGKKIWSLLQNSLNSWKEGEIQLTKGAMIFGVMGHTTGVAYLLLVINDVRPLKDNSITSPVMCNQSLSGKWICTRVTKSVAKALSIQADLKIYATALADGGWYTFLTESKPSLPLRSWVKPANSSLWLPKIVYRRCLCSF